MKRMSVCAPLKKALKRSPVAWLLGTMLSGFTAGISSVHELQGYSPLINLAHWESHELQTRLALDEQRICAITRERDVLVSQVTALRDQLQQADAHSKMSANDH